MINEEKVILMTQASLYENKEKKRNLKIGLLVLVFYVVTVVVYLSVLYGVSSYRYSRAKRSVSEYMQTLQKISDIYEKEDSGETTEDTDGGKES